MALALEPVGHLPGAEERCAQVLLVDQAHQRKVLWRLAGRRVVILRAGQADQLALATNRELGVFRFDQPSAYSLTWLDFFFKKSSSTLSRPISS